MTRASCMPPLFRGRRGLMAAAVMAIFLSPTLAEAAETIPGGYSPDADYRRGSLVIGSDGNVYRALDAVKAKDPVTAKDAPWQLADVAFDTTLDVPGRFDTIEKAFAFLAGTTISDSATVTVQVAPGTYELKGPLAIGHSQGNRVVLKGSKDPAKTTLDFGRGGGIVIDDRHAVGLDGMTLRGSQRKDQTAVTVDNGGSLRATNVVIEGFDLGIVVDNGSKLVAEKVNIATDDGAWGVKLDSLSCGRLTDCRVVRHNADGLGGLSLGFDVENGATADCRGCSASGWMVGFHSGRSGSLEVWTSEASGNNWGAAVYLDSTLSVFDSILEKNRERGLAVHGGSAVLHGCRVRNNKKFGVTSSCNGLVDFQMEPCLISGHEFGVHSYGGRFHGTMPTFKDNDENMNVVFANEKGRNDIFILK
jgi:hypothetical protein